MDAHRIRHTFLEFFRSKDHRVRQSASLIPNDPTMLLTIAGMVPFKPYFLGEAVPDHPRAATVQKSARTVDIENVGYTTRHLTFFEMLGNFSFGDYFKREAIRWAWELSTTPQEQGGFGFEPERIWATVFEEDDESAQLWLEETDVPAERIQRIGVPEGSSRLDASDNYWSLGGAGPCGPCSELYYDRGPEHGPDGGPLVDETRFLEFWNLVFMQYEQDADGNVLGELPQQNVDTGMGFERMAMLLQDVPNVYETDVLRPILDRAADVTGIGYGEREDADVSLRVLAEHTRSASFLIADGVLPSNEGRGYVLRRLLRRAVKHARSLGHEGAVMPAMTDAVRQTLGDAWSELVEQRELVDRVCASEEEHFTRTLAYGTGMLDEAIAKAKAEGWSHVPAATAFTLHDTYGFPVDLTVEIAREQGLDLDRDAFAEHMEAQRARSRAGAKGGDGTAVPIETYREAVARTGPSDFIGYTRTDTETPLAALLSREGLRDRAEEGDEVEVVLPRTPFYAEGGGQLGDHGVIETETGRLEVVDTFEPLEGLYAHRARVASGEVRTGQDAHAAIDLDRRVSITRGHTATHILHATLKEVVGDHAVQAGSAIDAGRFRFDFPHFEAVARDQLSEVEEWVNARIAADPEIDVVETSIDEAQRMGAIALFGEKYGEHVRVVRIGDFSKELCGGTHVHRTPEVGLFTVLAEGSIAANLRRIEAVTGPEAFQHLARERMVAEQVAHLLNVGTDEAVQRVEALLERVKAAEKAAQQARQDALMARGAALLDDAERLPGPDGGSVGLLAAGVEGADRDGLKILAADLRNRLGSGVVVLGTTTPDGKASLVAVVSPDLGIEAADVLRPGAETVGGGAGGRGELAQAGGKEGDRLGDALEASRREARERLGAA
ncbi:alanine--tRNA ligase [Egibacter rhizosphaerae]|uniref:Alanine--tRNA ligase n=1 Tax=Egibacter rhizosphaerae TaxID=1670831 RepID=A0A411YJY3_9ACTN|nr:alanine--tRNA ligase [Egibacter rhizosphaerae]QBI21497.1 alanine--tRNA ligase [Egibacter rhizosphaerae]